MLRHYINRTQRQTGHKVKIIRTGIGKEFLNAEVNVLLEEKGIRHQKTVPYTYTPGRNGSVERENRTIIETARTMLHPLKVWVCSEYWSVCFKYNREKLCGWKNSL